MKFYQFLAFISFISISWNYPLIAGDEKQKALNRLEDLRDYHRELLEEAKRYDREREIEKNFYEALPIIPEILDRAEYDVFNEISPGTLEDYRFVVRALYSIYRNDDFFLMLKGYSHSLLGVDRKEKGIIVNFHETIREKFKRAESLPDGIRQNPLVSNKIFVGPVSGENNGVIVEPLNKDAQDSIKNIIYQIYGFINNYKTKAQDLSQSGESILELNRSFLWAKKQIIQNLIPALEIHFTKETIDDLKSNLESAYQVVEKRLDPETGRFDPNDRPRVIEGNNRERITLTRIDKPDRNRDREHERNALRIEMASRRADRREARENSNRPTESRPLVSDGFLSTPEGLSLLKEIAEEEKKVEKLQEENRKKIIASFTPDGQRYSDAIYKFSVTHTLFNYGISNLIQNPLLSFAALFGASYISENPTKASVLGSIIFDTPFDLADFFSAMVYDETLMGEPASTSDKVILGAMVLVPGVSGAIAREGIDLAKRFSKYGIREVESIASMVPRSSVDDVFRAADDLELVTLKEIEENIKVLEKWRPHYKKVNIEEAAVVNARDFVNLGYEPAFKDGSKVFEIKTTQAEEFVRVHGPENKNGNWLMKSEDIKGLDAKGIMDKFNLPVLPTSISKVNVPIGTNIRMGIVGSNKFGKGYGPVQFQVLDKVQKDWFTIIGDL